MTETHRPPPVLVDESGDTRWAGRRQYTVLQARFDGGKRFLAMLNAWRDDPARCERLHFVAVTEDVACVTAPDSPWRIALAPDAPPLAIPGVHRVEYEAGRVVLTLAIGDVSSMLQKLWLRADTFYLDFTDDPDPQYGFIAKALARLAADHATLHVTLHATVHATVQPDTRPTLANALEQAGFVCAAAAASGTLQARFAPRWRVRRHDPPLPFFIDKTRQRRAIVVGAGLAGCALVERLASRGWAVSLIDRHGGPARDASGNPAGVFHPIVWRDDSVAARLTRAGFFHALHRWSQLEHAGYDLQRSSDGLLQIADSDDDARAIAQAIQRFGLPPSYVQAVDKHAASELAGLKVARDGWFFPRGGWLSPAAVCAAQCALAGESLTTLFDREVRRIERKSGMWLALDGDDRLIADAPVLILANAGDAQRLAALHGLPTRGVRGQLTVLGSGPLDALRVPIVGDGYAVPIGSHRTLTGATYDLDSLDPGIRDEGHAENLGRLSRMLPDIASLAATNPRIDGRVAFRSVTSDRMPMIGSLASESAARTDAARLSGAWPLDLPRAPGLYGAFAFGSRGLIWATLAAELIVAQIEGDPWPIERELADAIDPARFLLRALRHGEFQ